MLFECLCTTVKLYLKSKYLLPNKQRKTFLSYFNLGILVNLLKSPLLKFKNVKTLTF